MRVWRWILVAFVLTGAGCRPALDDRPWLVREPEILAVKVDPPEVAPGTQVMAQLFALDPAEPLDTSAATWSLCHTPKPLGESRAVASSCLSPAATDVTGNPVPLTIPSDACTLFGPDTPQPAPGAPPTRPRDPDPTGGFFQPVTLSVGTALAVALVRVTCGLPGASLAIARDFQASYRPNQNPTIAGVALTAAGATVEPAAIPAGSRLSIDVTWAADAAETYPVFDRAANALVTTRESLTTSWFVTGGELDRAAAELRDPNIFSVSATWTAPAAPTTVELLVVLRDSRGASAIAPLPLTIR